MSIETFMTRLCKSPVLIFAALSLLITGTRLFGGEWVFGKTGADITLQFLSWREFGFAEMRHGNFPLWNPYIFGGVPYFAGFQSALLYPPNWVHLLLSPGTAINWTVAIHLFLAGYLMYRWCRSSDVSDTGAILAGTLWMFSGPFYLRVFAGHLSILCLIPWVPLLWEAIDRAFRKSGIGAALLGGFALAMMILAGHPQYVYFAGMVTAVYVLLRLMERSTWEHRLKFLATCIAIVAIGSLISCVQWLSALDANQEFVRSAGLDYTTAASFSLPPENVWTLLVPGLYGSLTLSDPTTTPPAYFGRAYLWEVSLFMSAAGMILALIGLYVRTFKDRQWRWFVLIALTAALALGAHTPLHRWLYDYLPGFGSFRGVTKFSFLLVMILCRLAADGWQSVRQAMSWRIAVSFATGVTLLLFALAAIAFAGVGKGKNSFWAHHLRDNLEAAVDAQEYYAEPRLLAREDFCNAASLTSAKSALIAALLAAAVTGCIIAARWKPMLLPGIVAIATIEMLVFAFQNRALSPAAREIPESWKPAIASLSPSARILTPEWPQEDWSMSWRIPNAWGYDPNVQLRYAQLIYASQGLKVEEAKNYIVLRSMPTPIRRMLRIEAILLNHDNPPFIKTPGALPMASLVPLPFVVKDRDELLKLVTSEQFDPQISVALESTPPFELASSLDPGEVKTLETGTDFMLLDANVKSPSFLLITQSFSRHWKVKSVLSPQVSFEVMPANWALMGIPLKAGRHILRIEYSPTSFVVGAWISGLSSSAFLALVGWQIFSTRRQVSSDN
jgi:hypothetical protein